MSNLSNNQFGNVYNFAAAKKVKGLTGSGAPVKMTTPETPEFTKHANEAMAVANSGQKTSKPKRSLFERAMDYIGMSIPD